MTLSLQSLNLANDRPSGRRGWRGGGVIAAALIVGSAMSFALRWRADDVIHAQWRAEISQASADELPALLAGIAENDEYGMQLLVELLDDDRPLITSATGRALRLQLERWRALSAEESSQKVATLARALAESSAQFRSPARFAAAQLADDILAWPFDDDAVRIAAILADCETILRSSGRGPDELMATAAINRGERELTAVNALPIQLVDPTTASVAPQPLGNALSGGGLPMDAHDVDSLPPVIADVYESDHRKAEPLSDPNAPPALIYEPLAVPLNLDDFTRDNSVQIRQGDRIAESNMPLSIAAPEPMPLGETADVELMRRLHDASLQDDAARELRRRGFDALRLEIARRLTDPNPQVRRQLANDLPQIAGVQARPWLDELAADPNAEVRRVAIAIIASGGGPEIEARLAQLRERESDARVAEVIDDALEQRR